MKDPNSTKSLKIVRQFNVPPQVVFDAFTQPESMRVWWTEDTIFDIDLRINGQWTITREEEGITYTMTGAYLEIDEPHRLRFSIAMPQFSPNSDIISIEIAARGDSGSRMTFIQTGKDIASELSDLPEGSISESEKGWQQGFDLMEEAWKKR